MDFKPHPCMLYKHPGTPEEAHLICADEAEETKARAEGFHGYNETPKASEPKALEDMKAGELLAYAKAKGYDLGDMKAQHGAEKILAAIQAIEAAAKDEV